MRPVAPSSDWSIRAVRSRTDDRKPSTSRVRATIRPARRRTTRTPSARATNAATGSMTVSSAKVTKARTGSTLPCPKLGEEGVPHLDEITDDDHVGEIRDGRIGITIHGHDRGSGLHADLVLDGPADAHREI